MAIARIILIQAFKCLKCTNAILSGNIAKKIIDTSHVAHQCHCL